MKDIVAQVGAALQENADEKTQKNSQNFFKEEIRFHGVAVPVVTRIGKEFFRQIENQPKAEIFSLCEELWRSGFIEESFIACNWSYALRKHYQLADFQVFERWVDSYVGNWASCDTLCNHTIGTFIEMYPDHIGPLRTWTASANRWKKRAAAVSLIIPARKGLFLADIFAIADALLLDTDDLVQKGYGWMLKAASQAHQAAVFDFVMGKRAVMPRTAFRYAIEKMPPEMRAEAMKKPGKSKA